MYKRKRPHVKCDYCGRVMMPTADGRFRSHVRHRKSAITPAHRTDAGSICRGTGKPAWYTIVTVDFRPIVTVGFRPQPRSSLGEK